MRKDEPPIIVEQIINRPTSTVWKAITELPQMIKWFFENIPDFKPEVTFYTEFNVNTGKRDFLHQWKIVEVIHSKKITYDWSYRGYNGKAIVSFELSEENVSTKVMITNLVTESFPEDIPEFSRESCIGGWTYFLGRLKDFLEND